MADAENKYAVPVDALERGVRVPPDEQVEEHAEPPPPDVVNEAQREARTLLRWVGDL